MGRPRRYKQPVRNPFDWFAGMWSKGSRTKSRRSNRKATWWITNLWHKPSRIFLAMGGIVVILLVVTTGMVSGRLCLGDVGCVMTRDGGIVLTTEAGVRP